MRTYSWVNHGGSNSWGRHIDLSRYSLHGTSRCRGRDRKVDTSDEIMMVFGKDGYVPMLRFPASKDNTNFLFRIEGPMNDALAAEFNSMFDARGPKQVVATARRMRLLKDRGCSIVFERAVEATARRNLAMVGGRETAAMVAEMLRRYYYDGEGASSFSSMSDLVHWLAVNNTCNVEDVGGVEAVYWYQISHLLYAMFTGMRLGSVWSGRSSVNGGYIIARNDGEVLAYHTCIADEFMDFLVQRLALEQPSHGRHLSMCIEKGDDSEYYIKLPLQVRFKAMKQSQEPAA